MNNNSFMKNTYSREQEIRDNLKLVRKRIEAACLRSGRKSEDVTLLAVSKKKPLSDIIYAFNAGQMVFGENYVQELLEKQKELSEYPPKKILWHMIGHLQKNKVKYLVGKQHLGKVMLIHSVDSVELAERIDKEVGKALANIEIADDISDIETSNAETKIVNEKACADIYADILIEVNVAEENSKWGIGVDDCLDAARKISLLPHIRIRGLMTSAPYTEDPETNRTYFRKLYKLFNELKGTGLNNAIIDTLSMGMSGDYEVAIEEGATIVRIGTGIFGERH